MSDDFACFFGAVVEVPVPFCDGSIGIIAGTGVYYYVGVDVVTVGGFYDGFSSWC